jgi:hypothetical protein
MDGITERYACENQGTGVGIAFDKIFKYSKSTSISMQILRINNKNHKLLVNEDVLYDKARHASLKTP